MIYVIESGEHFKIGFTDVIDVISYLNSRYNTHNPDWKLIYLLEGNRSVDLKSRTDLKHLNFRGDWFHKFQGWKEVVLDIVKDNQACSDKQSVKVINKSNWADKLEPFLDTSHLSDVKLLIALLKLQEKHNGTLYLTYKNRKDLSQISGVGLSNMSRNFKRLKELGIIDIDEEEKKLKF